MKNLKNKRILITAGPVWVPIDSVRIITNIFRGTLGVLIAKEAIKKGAKVTLLLGPGGVSISKKLPKNLRVIYFRFFDELYELMEKEISSKKYEIVIHSAAVADYKPIQYYKGKISSKHPILTIHLKPTPKIVDQIKHWNPQVFLVKFKLEVNINRRKLIEKAYQSMQDSNADLIVANDLKDMKGQTHKALIIDPQKKIVTCNTKKEIAKKLLNIIASRI
jgi:phosphopantothenoylcysteine synthetase/decarboxylase